MRTKRTPLQRSWFWHSFDFEKYDKFDIGYREEDHQLYLEYSDIIKMYDAMLDDYETGMNMEKY